MDFGELLYATESAIERRYSRRPSSVGGTSNVPTKIFRPHYRMEDPVPATLTRNSAKLLGEEGVKRNLQSSGGPGTLTPDGKNVSGWASLATMSNVGLGLTAVGAVLDTFGTLKAGFDAYKDSKERAKQLVAHGEGEAAGFEQQAELVRAQYAEQEAEDVTESYRTGTNVGGANLKEGTALGQLLERNKADVERRAKSFESSADALRRLRGEEARLTVEAGKKARTRGILSGLGTGVVKTAEILGKV